MWGSILQYAAPILQYAAPIIGGIIGSKSSGNAAGAQVQGQQNAIDEQNKFYNQASNIYAPQRQVGYGADALLSKLQGQNGGTPDYSGFENSPGYKFALKMGEQATDRNAAARGGLYSANTLGAVNTNAQGIASEQYNNYVGQLLSMAGLGNQANAGTVSAGENAANNISQGYANQGNANASGILGKGNAWGNAINQVGGLAKNTNWSSIFGGGGAPWGASYGDLAGIGGTGTGSGITGIGTSGAADIAGAAAQPIGAGLGEAAGTEAATTEGIAGWGTGTAAGTPTAGLGGMTATGAQTAGAGAAYAPFSTVGSGMGVGEGAGALAGIGGTGTGAGITGIGASGAADIAAVEAQPIGAGLAGAGEGTSAATAGTLGAAGPLLAAAIPAAVLAKGLSSQPYQLTAKYWENAYNGLTKGVSGNATYDAQTPPAEQIYNAKNALYNDLRNHPSGNLSQSGLGKGGNAIPANILALAKKYGMLNADGSLNKNWSQKEPVAPRYSAYGKLLPPSTNTYYDPSLLGSSGSKGGPGGKAY